MQISARPTAGFTLLELIIVIALMALTVGGAVATYRQFNDKQRVVSEAKQLIALLRTAQRRISVGDKPAACAGRNLNGYTVSGSNSTYTLTVQCASMANITVSTKTMASDMQIFAPFSVQFIDLGRGVVVVPSSSPTVALSTPLFHYELTVTNTGEIQENGPLAGAAQ